MAEIRCPKCKEIFQVDDSDYAQIVTQIRDKEFDAELRRREEALNAKKESDLEIVRLNAEKKQEEALRTKLDEIASKEKAIAELEAKLVSATADRELAVMKAVTEREKTLAEKENEIN